MQRHRVDIILTWNKPGFHNKRFAGSCDRGVSWLVTYLILPDQENWTSFLFFFFFTTLCTVKPFDKKGIINHKKLILNLLHE